jgi:hypothetical protein
MLGSAPSFYIYEKTFRGVSCKFAVSSAQFCLLSPLSVEQCGLRDRPCSSISVPPCLELFQGISGKGTGLADRLPLTGSGLLTDDANLALDPSNGLLTILSTNSDLNGQQNLATGEYLGTSLASLGFNGHGNFRVQARFVNVQYADDFDQFGL